MVSAAGVGSTAATGREEGRATTMPSLLAEGTETAHTLPMPPAAFGLLAILAFAVLLFITLAFRNVGNRH